MGIVIRWVKISNALKFNKKKLSPTEVIGNGQYAADVESQVGGLTGDPVFIFFHFMTLFMSAISSILSYLSHFNCKV